MSEPTIRIQFRGRERAAQPVGELDGGNGRLVYLVTLPHGRERYLLVTLDYRYSDGSPHGAIVSGLALGRVRLSAAHARPGDLPAYARRRMVYRQRFAWKGNLKRTRDAEQLQAMLKTREQEESLARH